MSALIPAPADLMTPAPAPTTITEVLQMAKIVADSGLFPAFKSPQAAAALMLLCRAKGMDPMTAVERYHIVQGRPVMRAEAMLSEFLAAGGKVEWHERSESIARATFSHPQGGSITLAWTIEQAKAAGLTGKDVWRQYPRQMLHARLVSEGVRSVCPGVTNGLYTPEEATDIRGDQSLPATTGAKESDILRPDLSEAPAPERNWLKARPGTTAPGQEAPFGPDQPLPARQGQPAPAPSRRRSPLEEAADAFVDLAEGLGYVVRSSDGRPSKKGLLSLLSTMRGSEVTSLPASAGEWASACQELTDWHQQPATLDVRGGDEE